MSRNASLVLRAIYAICLLGATCTHVAMLWQHGVLWDYGGAHLPTRIYWTSHTVLDPLAALLLFVRPRVGLILTALIIVSDVLHNTSSRRFASESDVSFSGCLLAFRDRYSLYRMERSFFGAAR